MTRVNDEMKAAIERTKLFLKNGMVEDASPTDLQSLMVESKTPKFSFGEKALANIAKVVRHTPNKH